MTDYTTLLHDRVTLSCRCIDRIFLQAWVPNLQTPGLVARFLRRPRLSLPVLGSARQAR